MAIVLILGAVPRANAAAYEGEQIIRLASDMENGAYTHTAFLDDRAVEEFKDYIWRADPSEDHADVKDAPAEYYAGEKPNTDAAVYIAHDIFYYPSLPADGFQLTQYDDNREWCYYYPESSAYHDYIFATLPFEGSDVPIRMTHTPEEAYQNAVLHIQKPGTYRLKGNWFGQIWVDLGDADETFSNSDAKVRLILDGVNLECSVAPALVFYSLYECDHDWESRTVRSASVDTSDAGAVIIIADGSQNNFSGENVYRMLRAAYKSDESQNPMSAVKVQKKQRKIDGALYSFVSMRITGEEWGDGVLNIKGGFEGLDSELHLTINGGKINIFSQDDGINVNEDGVSVLTINGGDVHILAGLGMEGDGIDSNGYLALNGGTLITMANPRADSGMDSDRGTYVNGGTVVALGSTMDWAESDEKGESVRSGQAVVNLQFASAQNADEAVIITDASGNVIFAYDPDKDEVAKNNARWYQGAIVSSPNIRVGQSYHIYVGGDLTGEAADGVYNVSTVESFTDAAKQQCYTSTGSFARPAPPPDGNGNPPPPPPMGGFGSVPPGFGSMPPANHEFNPGNPFPPEDFNNNPPPPPPGGVTLVNRNGKREFVMTERVNGFQAVTDYVGAYFNDVPENGDFYDAIMWASGTGVAEGEAENVFGSNSYCSRGNTILYLWRAAGSPNVTNGYFGSMPGNQAAPMSGNQAETFENPFTDVKESDEYYQAVLWATRNGITKGVSDTRFAPDHVVTRAQALAFLHRWTGEPDSSVDNPFTDVPSDSYYFKPVLWAVQNNITKGVTDTNFLPAGTLSKGQFLTFLYRYTEANLMPNPFGDPPPFPPDGNGQIGGAF